MKNETTLLIRLPAELKDAINAQAAVLDRSASWLVRNALTVYLGSLKEAGHVDVLK